MRIVMVSTALENYDNATTFAFDYMRGSSLAAVIKTDNGELIGEKTTFSPQEEFKIFESVLNDVYESGMELVDLATKLGAPVDTGVFVWTTLGEENYGANVILKKDWLDGIWREHGDFYLLPSSVHEWLVIPTKNATMGVRDMQRMVHDVNETLDHEDLLSYDTFRYDGEKVRRCAKG